MEPVKRIVDEYIEKAEFEKEYYLDELQKLSDVRDELQNEVNELNDVIDNLVIQQSEVEDELLHARRSFTGLQLAVAILVFVYGMLYGVVLCPK